MTPLVTLLSDFGTLDGYVGALKGVILARTPEARLVDLSHDIPPHDVHAGARALRAAVPWFPRGTIHLAVVDPGVGTSRRPLLLRSRAQLLVGPDNGLLSLAAAGAPEAWVLDRPELFLEPVSDTFAGRDLFASVVGHLAAGLPPQSCGTAVQEFVRLEESRPRAEGDRVVVGEIVCADRFGNLISNVRRSDLPVACADWTVTLGERQLGLIRRCYGEAAPGQWLAYWGSGGELEIGVRDGSAAAQCGCSSLRGLEVKVCRR